MSRFLWELFLPPHHEGVKLGQARYGSIFDHFDFARIRGRIYVASRFVASPAELQKRREAAERALSTKLWHQDCNNWPDLRNSFRCRLMGFARQNTSSLDQDALRESVGCLKKIFVEGAIQHFIQQPSSMVPVGDWVRRTREWTGAPAAEVIGVLQGCHSDSADCLQAIDELVEAINCFPQAGALVRDQSEQPMLRLERLRRTSPLIEERLQPIWMNMRTGSLRDSISRMQPCGRLRDSRYPSPRVSTGPASQYKAGEISVCPQLRLGSAGKSCSSTRTGGGQSRLRLAR
jgi:hypothetical protein